MPRTVFMPGCLVAGLVAICWMAGQAFAQEVLLEGFENLAALKTAGKIALVNGADAVTEGQSALELPPGGSVTVAIAPKVIKRAGWLKIDTFEAQPVMACLRIGFERGNWPGYVNPGKDVLALPLGLSAKSDRGPWPPAAENVCITNIGQQPVVIDNLRLAEPAPAPPDAVLLDFGPADQVLWPGFEPAEAEDPHLTWSGSNRIYSLGLAFPDPLAGDFSGGYPGYKLTEAVTLKPTKGAAAAWIWLTHYSDAFHPAIEHAARLNGKEVLRESFTPAQALSSEGLLQGKDQPWSAEWFEKNLVPQIATRLECALKAGANTLDLANCQVAALAMVPQSGQSAMKAWLAQLDEDLRRYRRQFVLACASKPACDVVPSEAEAKAGVMLFEPPPDDGFYNNYAPTAEHRCATLKLTAPSGGSILAALVAVPCADLTNLQMTVEPAREAKNSLPGSAFKAFGLEAMPVVVEGCLYYQPFLPIKAFKSASARDVYWFAFKADVPETAKAGQYRCSLRVGSSAGGLTVPVELEVVSVPMVKDRPATYGLNFGGYAWELLPLYHNLLPPARHNQLVRDVYTQLSAAGWNASMVAGPKMNNDQADGAPVAAHLRERLRVEGPGKCLIDAEPALRAVASLQSGTARYRNVVASITRACADAAGKGGLTNYALYCGSANNTADVPDLAKKARAIADAGGKPAVVAAAAVIAAADGASRNDLLSSADTLVTYPAPGLLALCDQFKRGAPGKTLLLQVAYADVYELGFYCWGVGADGVMLSRAVSALNQYNAMFFECGGLVMPSAGVVFEPTWELLRSGQAMSDFYLARRCEALGKATRAKGGNADGLDKVLTAIRATADKEPPRRQTSHYRSMNVPPQLLQEWRTSLLKEAAKLTAGAEK